MNIENPNPLAPDVEVEEPRLYKAREPIFPKAGKGVFRTFKWRFLIFALAVYYVTPWLRWDRGPFAPDQAVLIDLANRRFYFFFIEIWPQEFYYIAGLLIMAGLGLFLVTSAVGRAWCGYACPQTVWTDLFMWVERRIDGDRNAQIRLHEQGWTADKLRKRVAKHGVWLLIALATGGAWVFYFADAPTLLVDLVTGQAATVAYATIAVLTFTTYSLAGLMREQVCIYMCPWPRIQGAMLDENSLTVTYNDWRGEPRSRHRKKALAAAVPVGDCVDCNACVAVCPMGIDIRNGPQLECITCALCIDACDAVMEKTGQDKGLIAYTTFRDYDRHKAGDHAIVPMIRRVLRPRTLIYLAVWASIGLAMLAMVTGRDRLDLNVLHDRNPLYTPLTTGEVRNGYTVKTLNMVAEPRRFLLRTEGLPGATLSAAGAAGDPAPTLEIDAPPDAVREVRVLVTAPADGPRREFDFVLEEITVGGAPGEADRVGAVFHGPED
ncbi:cytochrome c oxidase accessory protein CcoG [Rubrimonas cliftonensis]|uniref:Cytochrome c oxidase accessory protein FixG n=1 Tax=Rubrimonas cliftonensis TaxID=89524 RepID=A0A1H4DMZ9_9RHOB|nr:cytochrome c oxidase accessory protein CcoG [Rubrimonas cliftonensis]SEA73977.1 cytochrome c oxidase accessory protein FixG [Rubrimonas cliftonensis]